MVADPKLKPTTAMKRVIATRKAWDEGEETLLRRWQVKWKDAGAALLAAAKERAAPKPMRGGCVPAHGHYGIAAYRGFEESAAMKAAWAFDESPMMKAMRAIEDSPVTKAARAIEDSPVMKTMRDMQRMQDLIDPPLFRRIREQERAVRDRIDPPSLRAARGLF